MTRMRPAFSIGDMVRQVRVERGLTQTQLARRLGLTGNAVVSRLERGTSLPSEALRRKLAKVLHLEPALLETRVQREARGSTATALLTDLGTAFERAQRQMEDELDSLRKGLAQHQARLAHVLRLSEFQLLWGLSDKLAWEATVKSAWIVTPDLLLDVQSEAVRKVVRENVSRGVTYRYLVPQTPGVVQRAKKFMSGFPGGSSLEVRSVRDEGWLFLSELVLYDAQTSRRLGLMIAPTARTDVDCVLSPTHSARLARGFAETWSRATPLSLRSGERVASPP